jgi:5-methylcytosine-specific restriction enzyme subunit McrC
LKKHLITLNASKPKATAKFTPEELKILQTDFAKKIQIIPTFEGGYEIAGKEYAGYIILPNHIINIEPKMHPVSFINMVKYALDLPEVSNEIFGLSEKCNHYDLVVLFLLGAVERLLHRGVYSSYADYEENLKTVRGKIFFKEHLSRNYGRGDKVYCSFSELTVDILENRIIKYTLFHLMRGGEFISNQVSLRVAECYRRFDQVELVHLSQTGSLSLVNYTPLNEHYRPIVELCELILRDSSVNENIGPKASHSFLIDMDKLFEKFVGKLLSKRLCTFNVQLQAPRYPEVDEDKKDLKIIIDILLKENGSETFVLDTKYKEFENIPSAEDVAQLVYYSLTTGVRKVGLIYPGRQKTRLYELRNGVNLHVVFINLDASSKAQFEQNCSSFVSEIKRTNNRERDDDGPRKLTST